MTNGQTIGERITELREAAKISKAAVARACQTSDVTVGYWESGTIREIGHSKIIALAELFQISATELLNGLAEPVKPDPRAPKDAVVSTCRECPGAGCDKCGGRGYTHKARRAKGVPA